MGGFLPEEFGWLLRGYLPARAICCAASIRIILTQPVNTKVNLLPQKNFFILLLYGHFVVTGLLIASMALVRVLDFDAFVNALTTESIIFGLAWGFILPDLAHAAFKENTDWLEPETRIVPRTKEELEALSPKLLALQLIDDGLLTNAFDQMIQYWEDKDSDTLQILLARRSEFLALKKETLKGVLAPGDSRYQVAQIRSVLIEMAQKME
ncbi:MAG TPA: hypothetical protein DCF33_08520 [Saprospirales bacterium]|nr:hypothetical protein [Saprospirales bacterium]